MLLEEKESPWFLIRAGKKQLSESAGQNHMLEVGEHMIPYLALGLTEHFSGFRGQGKPL